MQPADVLDKAADAMEGGHWTQFALEKRGKYCALGAINLAVSGDSMGLDMDCIQWGMTREATHAVEADLGYEEGWIVNWNNLPGRTEDEVVEQFRATARRLRDE